MKKIYILITVILISIGINAQSKSDGVEINWIPFEEALAKQKENPKKIMMDVYTIWCGPCKLLDKNTFHNVDLVNYVNEHYYAVKFNAEGNEKINYENQDFGNPNFDAKKTRRNSSHQLTNYLKVRAFPSILFFEEDGGLLAPIPGYRTPKQLEIFLKLFKTNKHKEINTEEAFAKYQKEFQYEFRN